MEPAVLKISPRTAVTASVKAWWTEGKKRKKQLDEENSDSFMTVNVGLIECTLGKHIMELVPCTHLH